MRERRSLTLTMKQVRVEKDADAFLAQHNCDRNGLKLTGKEAVLRSRFQEVEAKLLHPMGLLLRKEDTPWRY